MGQPKSDLAYLRLRAAAADQQTVRGLTHEFYRYPARFSPEFAATAIQCYSRPGELVLDPYMGGGTTVVEAMASGRRVFGADVNSLAVFVARVKTTPLTRPERIALSTWTKQLLRHLNYRSRCRKSAEYLDDSRTRNLSLPRARSLKKIIAIALYEVDRLPTKHCRDFARCCLLRTAQWALDGRRRSTSLDEFRSRFATNLSTMLDAIVEFSQAARRHDLKRRARYLVELGAADINQAALFSRARERAALVVTSPPYPGIHVLYHRWQVDGRKETPAPYWISQCSDGHGGAFYTFGDRRHHTSDAYFDAVLSAFLGIHHVLQDGAHVVQMIAFSEPATQLHRYLEVMSRAGFEEQQIANAGDGRIWRDVPNRRWHAAMRGRTKGAQEVILVHRAR